MAAQRITNTFLSMRKLVSAILLSAISMATFAQAHFDGPQIVVDEPGTPGFVDYLITIQNADAIWEKTSFWDDDGVGEFASPYCNVIVSRTGFDAQLVAVPGFTVTLQREPVTVSVAAMPGRKVSVNVAGPNVIGYDIRFRHAAYGSWYLFYDSGAFQQYFPSATGLSGQKTLFIPYPIKGQQGAAVTVHTGGACDVTLSRIFYMN